MTDYIDIDINKYINKIKKGEDIYAITDVRINQPGEDDKGKYLYVNDDSSLSWNTVAPGSASFSTLNGQARDNNSLKSELETLESALSNKQESISIDDNNHVLTI